MKIYKKLNTVKSAVALFLVIIIVFCSLKIDANVKTYGDDGNVITYKLNSTTELTYDASYGKYGRVIYRKKHFSTGSGIRYYTKYFVISVGEETLSADLSSVDSEISEIITVSEDGKGYSEIGEAVSAGADFYWFENSTEDEEGYITTTYVLDGSIFYDIINRAAQKGKTGDVYIHHVFSVTGGKDINSSDCDSWHKKYGVVNDRPYFVYNDLLKLEWNNTENTHESQKACLNVPVPYKRMCTCLTAYFTSDGTIIKRCCEVNSFTEDWNVNVPSEITAGNKEYVPVSSMNGTYKGVQKQYVPKYVRNYSKLLAGTLGLGNYNNDIERTEAEKERIGAVRIWSTKAINEINLKNGWRSNSANTFCYHLSELSDSNVPWEIILYIPVAEKPEIVNTPTPEPTVTQKLTPTPSPSVSPSPKLTPTGKLTPKPTPTGKVTPSVTPKPSVKPSEKPAIITNVYVEYIDSENGKNIYGPFEYSTERNKEFIPETFSAYSIDNSGKFSPLAVFSTNTPIKNLSYDDAVSEKYNSLTITGFNKCSVKIPQVSDNSLYIKIFVPLKKIHRDCHVILKYFCYDIGKKDFVFLESAPLINKSDMTQTFSNGSIIYADTESFIIKNGKAYEPESLLGILYGNSPDELWNGEEYIYYIEKDGHNVIDELPGVFDGTGDPASVSFVTQTYNGEYYAVYINCSEVTDATNMTVHYFDAETGEVIETKKSKNYISENRESWVGINGKLVWGFPVRGEFLPKKIVSDKFENYVPVYYSNTGKKVKHKGCYGSIEHFYYGWGTGNSRQWYCVTCGKLIGQQFENDGIPYSKEVYDNGSFNDEFHEWSVTEYPQKYKASYRQLSIAYIRDRMTEDGGGPTQNDSGSICFNSDADTLWLRTDTDLNDGNSAMSFSPARTPRFNTLIVYIPCVKEQLQEITVKYAVISQDGKVEKIVEEDAGGRSEKGKPYTYYGKTVINGDTEYKITGKGAAMAYDNNTYAEAINDKTGEKGQNIPLVGENKWYTEKYLSDKGGILYIPVEKVDYIKPDLPDASESIYLKSDDIKASAIIKSVKEKPYDVNRAIPSNEYIYSEVTVPSYILEAEFENITGLKNIEFSVTRRIHYIDPYSGKEIRSENASGKIELMMSYSYWAVKSLNCYIPSNVYISNGSTDGKMTAKINEKSPVIERKTFDESERYVTENIPDKISAADIYITEGTAYSLGYYEMYGFVMNALNGYGSLNAYNDLLIINGQKILKDTCAEAKGDESGPLLLNEIEVADAVPDITFITGKAKIPSTRKNLEYMSAGEVRYELFTGDSTNEKTKSVLIGNINSVKVHTPVYLEMSIDDDNLKYVQYVNSDKAAAHAVTGRSSSYNSDGNNNCSSDFTINIKTEGLHRKLPGYGNRDYSEYILKKSSNPDMKNGTSGVQVMFPFDVYADLKNDHLENNDILLSAGTWNDIYDSYYVPDWVEPGTYEIKARAAAINASGWDKEADKANLSESEYSVYDTCKLEVSGKLYGLTLRSINSKASEWKNVFQIDGILKCAYPDLYLDGTFDNVFNPEKRYYYTVGTDNETGTAQILSGKSGLLTKNSRFILPLLEGSSPVDENSGMMKSGYVWNFSLNSTGPLAADEKSSLVILPSFYHLSADGKNRQRVDIWYSGSVEGKQYNYIKIGSETDKMNIFKGYPASEKLGIPLSEISLRKKLLNKDDSSVTSSIYTYGLIHPSQNMKMFTGDGSAAVYLQNQNFYKGEILKKYRQTWYFQYSLPDKYNICPYGYDLESYLIKHGGCSFNENFWIKDGYLVVSFDIGIYGPDGKLNMLYSNTEENIKNGMCNMWETEGYREKRITRDKNGNETVMNLKYGDTIVLYLPGSTAAGEGNVPNPPTNLSEDRRTGHLN